MATVFEQAALVLFQDQNLFPETVIYAPHGGEPKTIRARIERNPLRVEQISGAPVPAKVIEIDIAKDAALGIAVVKEGFDTVALLRQLGDAAPVTMTMTKILKQDEQSWKLEVEP